MGLQPKHVVRLPYDDRLARKDRIFLCPPLTQEIATAIKLIAPHFPVAPDEKSRVNWELDQNGSCWGEYEALQFLFDAMPQPEKVLEIGPGLGRSVVFLSKKLGWSKSEWHLYEGNGDTTKYDILGPRSSDSFCGNISLLQGMLTYNKVSNARIFDAGLYALCELPGPYQFIYSFYAVGFHWSIEYFLDDILALMDDNAVAVFTIPPQFAPFPALNELQTSVLQWTPVWPEGAKLKLLILWNRRAGK